MTIRIEGRSLRDDPDYAKCPRCLAYHRISRYENYDHLCDRCADVLVEHFPNHESVPFIKARFAELKQQPMAMRA